MSSFNPVHGNTPAFNRKLPEISGHEQKEQSSEAIREIASRTLVSSDRDNSSSSAHIEASGSVEPANTISLSSSSLPLEIWIKCIIPSLNSDDVRSLGCVDKNLYQVTVDQRKEVSRPLSQFNSLDEAIDHAIKYKYSSVDLRELNHVVTDEHIEKIVEHLPELKRLLIKSDKITDATVIKVAEELKGLQSLDLCGCDKISDEALIKVAEELKGLQSLSLWNCKMISDEALIKVAEELKGLQDKRQGGH